MSGSTTIGDGSSMASGSGAIEDDVDVVVVGAGIAGASVAAELVADGASVALLEREPQPGYHTTGRSAALFARIYGPPPIRALTRASAAFFESPPPGFAEQPLLGERGAILLAGPSQRPSLDALFAELRAEGPVRALTAREVCRRVPLLRADYVSGGLLDTDSRDIDVDALHQGYLRAFRRAGGRLHVDAGVRAMVRSDGRWTLSLTRGSVRAGLVVDAAGAWADELAALAGARPIGLVPKRRTALLVAPPPGVPIDDWPAVIDVDERFYLKPDTGRLLISPADETPSPPTDAQPEELDVAVCVDRIQQAFELPVERIERAWAGLRSFVPDKCPVCDHDDALEGFFWLAGQGGYGIQSAPALSRVAAAMIGRRALPADVLAEGFTADSVAVGRTRARASFAAPNR